MSAGSPPVFTGPPSALSCSSLLQLQLHLINNKSIIKASRTLVKKVVGVSGYSSRMHINLAVTEDKPCITSNLNWLLLYQYSSRLVQLVFDFVQIPTAGNDGVVEFGCAI